jgi:hypothetical protein
MGQVLLDAGLLGVDVGQRDRVGKTAADLLRQRAEVTVEFRDIVFNVFQAASQQLGAGVDDESESESEDEFHEAIEFHKSS